MVMVHCPDTLTGNATCHGYEGWGLSLPQFFLKSLSITTTMKTTVIVNDLAELIAVATFAGVEINVAEISVSFPYPFVIDHQIEIGENEEMTFDEFKSKYLVYE